MESLGDQIWSDVNDEWAEYVHGEGNSPALQQSSENEEKRDEKMVERVTF